MQIRLQNLTQKRWTVSPGDPFILGVKRSKVEVTRHEQFCPYTHW